jgi:hypothetical protein
MANQDSVDSRRSFAAALVEVRTTPLCARFQHVYRCLS